jgi:predicted phosphodiesterase
MKFVFDPEISVKIDQMKRRVRWQEELIKAKNINQTKLVIDDSDRDNPEFSFLVIGDSGCGSHLKHHPQRKIAEMMLQHQEECRFVLHTGDVVYQGETKRAKLLTRRSKLNEREQQIREAIDRLNPNNPEEAEQIDDYYAKLEHIAESQRDIDKKLKKHQQITDWEQLQWLKTNLVASWQDETVRGRIIFLHHPPYVTEATKWNQGQTLEIRDRLRQVFDDAVREIGTLPPGRSLVDVVIAGHAHCMEHLYTEDTGHADSDTNWIVCGGSGHSLRRQKREGAKLYQDADLDTQPIGQSQLFLGRNGRGRNKKRPYSFLRIDVSGGDKPRLTVKPYVAEWHQHQWHKYEVEPFFIKI